MEDKGAPKRSSAEPEDPSPVDMEFVRALPGGKVMMPIERDGRLIWLVVKGHVTPQARTEFLADVNHMVRSGLWRQNWQPPQAG